MRKISILFFYFLLASLCATAQDYPDFGIPSKEEIDLKDCPFEKGAPAVILIHEAFSYSEDGMQLTTSHHFRIKILNQSGVNAANIKIPFFRENYFERIINLEAVTINIADDGTVTRQKVDKKIFFTTRITDELGEISFAFPSVKAGSIIEYQYVSIMKSYRGLQDWYFQDELPVMISRYHLRMLNDKQFSYRLRKKPDLNVTVLEEPGKIFFEMQNVPSLINEPYMDARVDNVQCVTFEINHFFSRWGAVSFPIPLLSWRSLQEFLVRKQSFWGELEQKIEGTDDFIKQVKTMASPEEKMNAVYEYVRKNMRWNNYDSRTSETGVNKAWQNHEGTRGDINLVLTNLLKKAGLNAYPILVSERQHGKVDTGYAYLDQFNTVFAIVVIAKKSYYLDATTKFTPAYITPSSILNTLAFMVTDNAFGLIKVSNDSLQYREGIYVDMKLSGDGILKGNALIKSKGYARIERKRGYEENKEKFIERFKDYKGIPVTLDNFDVINLNNDSLSFDQKFDFSINLSSSGDYKFIPLNIFSGLYKSPFLSDNRFSNINLGYNKTITLNTSIELPADYYLEEIPGPETMVTLDKGIVFSRQVTYNKDNNIIYTNTKIEFNKNYYEAALYPALKDAFKKLFTFLNEELPLKKKK